MKRILLFASIALVALFSNCKKDDDPTNQELIVAKWKASKAVIGTTDVLVATALSTTELEVTFNSNNTVTFHWINTILTTNPPSVNESDLNGTYSLDGDILTIVVTSGADSKTVIGPVEVSDTHLHFTATSGDTSEFINLLVADKI